MGGCGTKPKTDTTTNIPHHPDPTNELPLEDPNKHQSLTTLFKENEGKESTKVVEIPRETQTLEDITVSEKVTDVLGQTAEQPLKLETPVEEMNKDLGEVPVEAKLEKSETVEAVSETKEPEEIKTKIPEEKEKVMEDIPVLVEPKVEKATTVVVSTETQKPEESKRETPVEEKIEEIPEAETEKPETKTTPVLEISEEKKAVEEQTFEKEKLDITQIPETCEEKKLVAEIPVEETASPEISVEKQTEEVFVICILILWLLMEGKGNLACG